jgi:hypothetical protein
MAQKPLGVRILSVSVIFVSAVFLVWGLQLFVNFTPSFNIFAPFPGIPQLYWLSLVFVSVAVFGFVVGLGLWGVRRWAYYLALGSSIVLAGFGFLLIVGWFIILYFLNPFSVLWLGFSSLLVFGIAGSYFASLMLVIGIVSIVVGAIVIRYLTEETRYSFY